MTHIAYCIGVTKIYQLIMLLEDSNMKQRNRILVVAGGLLISGGLIAGLASAASHKRGDKYGDGYGHGHHMKFKAKKLDTNNDGAISQEELLARHISHFSKLDADNDGMLSIEEFNARPIAMFSKLDADGNGLIAGDELPRRHKGGKHGHGHSDDHDYDKPATSGTAS